MNNSVKLFYLWTDTHTLTHATCPCAITDRLTATDTRFTQSRERQLSQLTNKGNLLFSQHKGQPPAKGKLLLLLRRSQTRGRFALATAHALGVPTPQQVDNHRHYLKLYSVRPEGPPAAAQADHHGPRSGGRVVRHAAGVRQWLPPNAPIIGLPRCTRTRRSLRGEKRDFIRLPLRR